MKKKYFYAFVVTEDLLFGACARLEEMELPLKQIIPGMQRAPSSIVAGNGQPQMVVVYKLMTCCTLERWDEVQAKLKALEAMGVKAFNQDPEQGKVLDFPLKP